MTNVSFNEEPTLVPYSVATKSPVLVRMVLATKIVQTDKQAEYVLIGIATLALILTVVLWPKGRPQPNMSEIVPVAGPSDVRR